MKLPLQSTHLLFPPSHTMCAVLGNAGLQQSPLHFVSPGTAQGYKFPLFSSPAIHAIASSFSDFLQRMPCCRLHHAHGRDAGGSLLWYHTGGQLWAVVGKICERFNAPIIPTSMPHSLHRHPNHPFFPYLTSLPNIATLPRYPLNFFRRPPLSLLFQSCRCFHTTNVAPLQQKCCIPVSIISKKK